ncbi:uncharacterized protein LOC110461050 [Mizuhopecten yessoensis]|uniref:Uncharacterized protein n=1 Tax=Mizuhopecten yessoensis TaxID=6573 RepID=A0A210Q109_MIZYE|nr:uncharacterized protein LOC110461050 [Mizuhopecten yessoensis]OWF42444.1 hypothetical protein KP79_PYT22395 [Mizuhopecten yessoensis]
MAEEGLSDEIVIAIAVLCFLILIVIAIFIIICVCKNKISWLSSNEISEEEVSHKSRFGEAKIDFITKNLDRVRYQRGAPALRDKRHQRLIPRYHDDRERYHDDRGRYHDNVSYYEEDLESPRHYENVPPKYRRYPRENESYAPSIHLRRYEESLTDGHSTRRSRNRRLEPLGDLQPDEVVTKPKSKKKRRSENGKSRHQKKKISRDSEVPDKTEVPMNRLPDSSKLKDSGWSNGTAKDKVALDVKLEAHPNAFSDSEASDVDIARKAKKSSHEA